MVIDLPNPGELAEPARETPVVRSKGFVHCSGLPSAREVEKILNLVVVVRQRDRSAVGDSLGPDRRNRSMHFQPRTQ